MNITVNNYNTLKKDINWSKLTNPTVKALRDDMEFSMEFYNDDEGIKETVDLWLKQLNKALPKDNKKPIKKGRPTKREITLANIKKYPPKSKPKKQPKKTTTIQNTIDHYSNEFMLIRRFFNIVKSNKKVSFRRIQLMYLAFEKAVVERKVRKTSSKASLFNKVNAKVVKLYSATDETKSDAVITVKDKSFYNELETYVKSQKINYAITLLKRFIGFQGIKPEKAKVRRLIKAIDTAIKNGKVSKNNRLYQDVIDAKKELKTYLKEPKKITPKKQGLTGVKKKTVRKKPTKKGLKKPFSQPIAKTKRPIKLQTASQLLSQKQVHKHYDLSPNFKKILGNIEIKEKDSVAITLDAPQGAMKTRFLFQVGNEFAGQGKNVLFVSLEEHPTSKLFQNKLKQYVTPVNQNRFYPIGELENNYQTLAGLTPQFDVIMVDSWNKIAEDNRNIDFDKDLRKKFNGKLFATIFQRTTTGTMRGGSKSQFDGDVILKIKKFANYKYNYVYQDKNRYMVGDYIYNIFEKKIYDRVTYEEMLAEKEIKSIN